MEDSTAATVCSESHSEEQVTAIIAKRPRSRSKMTHPERTDTHLIVARKAEKSQHDKQILT